MDWREDRVGSALRGEDPLVMGPVWRYSQETRNAPEHAYSDEKDGELRAAITAVLVELIARRGDE
jgi:hypothetical protein